MDITQLGLWDKMQMPQYIFGRRWPIGMFKTADFNTAQYLLSADALPEQTVFWSLFLINSTSASRTITVSYFLSDYLPTTDAEYFTLEPIFDALVGYGANKSTVHYNPGGPTIISGFKVAKETAGRRLCIRIYDTTSETLTIQAGVIVSSVPKEISDWLLSGQDKNL